jgi:hypothetical protein
MLRSGDHEIVEFGLALYFIPPTKYFAACQITPHPAYD